jgi:hypothetical protein
MALAWERMDLEPEDCRRLGVHMAGDPRLDERARSAHEVVERGHPDPPGHRRQRRRLPPGQTSAARTHDCRLHTHPVDLPATAAWLSDGLLTLPGTGSISSPQSAGRDSLDRRGGLVGGWILVARGVGWRAQAEADGVVWTAGLDGTAAGEEEEVVALT